MRNADGSFTPLGATNTGGSINAICWASSAASSSDSSANNGTLYIGGSFTSVGSTSSSNVIAYDISQGKFVAMTGLSGPVESLYCDDSHSEVWAGGVFSAPAGSGANVAVWSTETYAWTAVPFGGLNAAVESISASADGNSLYFAGQFTTQFADSGTVSTVAAFRNLASVSLAPTDTVTTGNSGYFAPYTFTQGGVAISASPTTSQASYDSADVLLCSGAGTWFAGDDTTSEINLIAQSYLSATGVRIANGQVDGRATTGFQLTTLPDGTLRTLTYTDPSTGQNATCSDNCPLSVLSTVAAQDFIFADGSLTITGVQIDINEWQGDSAALEYVQLLSEGVYASFQTGTDVCSSNATTSLGSVLAVTPQASTVLAVGNWEAAIADSSADPGIQINYMMAQVNVDAVSTSDTQLTLYPYVGTSGYYQVYLQIPGCASIGDCNQRTSVTVFIFPQEGGTPYSISVDENVQDDTNVLIYSGLVDASTATFGPTITVSLTNPNAITGDSYIIVASGVQMTFSGPAGTTSTVTPPTVVSTGSLSGSSAASGAASTGSAAGTGGTALAGTQGTGSGTAANTGSATGQTAGTATSGTAIVSTSSPVSTSGVSTTSTSSTSTTSALPSATPIRVAFGVYQWTRSSNVNATSVLANSTESTLTQLGFALDSAYNASSTKDFSVNAVTSANDTIFVGGKFSTSTYANIVAVSSAGASAVAGQGLNGDVNTLATVGNYVYCGGAFTGIQQSGTTLQYLARYDPNVKAWAAVGGGVDGPVETIVPLTSGFAVVGNFTNVIDANGSTTSTGGYAVYNTSTSAWNTGGIIYGTGSAGTAGGNTTFIAGSFTGSSQNAVNGVASLITNSDGKAAISSMPGVSFSNNGSASTSTSSRRRSLTARLLSHVRRSVIDAHLVERADAIAIPEEPAAAPATLAGAYWTNTSASGSPTVTILGGNFTSGSNIAGLAFDSPSGMTGPGKPVSGVVRALAVVDNELFVGGTNVTVSGVGSGIILYDLANNSWSASGMSSLVVSNSGEVNVNAIKNRLDTKTIVAAGNFESAGSLPCPAVCFWDVSSRQWQRPGNSISSGEVRSIDFGDAQYGTLVAGGSFVLDGTNVFAASYSFANSTWQALGTLPGPVTSIAVDDRNLTNIFATGYASGDSTPYLQRWDGSSWSEQNSSALESGTVIQNLAFVPVKDTHTAQGSIESDRMLMASGNVFLAQSGNVSSALFDGQSWYPYLVGSTSTGTLAAASSLFWSEQKFSFSLVKYLARGLVVLVAMAIATGLILLLVLIILLAAYCIRRRDRKQQTPPDHYSEKAHSEGDVSSTHQLIHDSVQTALERSLLPGAAAGAGGLAAIQGSRPESGDSIYHEPEDHANPALYDDNSDEGRETVMRYDFYGPELQTGELAMRAGQRIIVLDDEQSEEWWYARDPATGREGVVPATYGGY